MLIIEIGFASAILFANPPSNQPLNADYWILNISPTQTETGTVTPNGTINAPLNQTGITVTATPLGINGFMHWRFDGQIVQNQSATIFVPKQEANSNHTLQAVFVIGTQTITPNAEVVTFRCEYDSNTDADQKFSLPIEVNLADGLSSHEAIRIAYKVADCMGKTRHTLDSTVAGDDGSWIVNLHWGLSDEDMGHTFRAEICPPNQTVYYSHCK